MERAFLVDRLPDFVFGIPNILESRGFRRATACAELSGVSYNLWGMGGENVPRNDTAKPGWCSHKDA